MHFAELTHYCIIEFPVLINWTNSLEFKNCWVLIYFKNTFCKLQAINALGIGVFYNNRVLGHIWPEQCVQFPFSLWQLSVESCDSIVAYYLYFIALDVREVFGPMLRCGTLCHFVIVSLGSWDKLMILSQVWCLIVSIPDLFPLSYFYL